MSKRRLNRCQTCYCVSRQLQLFFHHGEQCFLLTGTKKVFSFPVSLSLSLPSLITEAYNSASDNRENKKLRIHLSEAPLIRGQLPCKIPVALNCLLARRQHLPLVISAVTCISLRPFANGKSSAFSWPSEVAVSFRSFPCPLLSATVVSLRWLRWNPR